MPGCQRLSIANKSEKRYLYENKKKEKDENKILMPDVPRGRFVHRFLQPESLFFP